MFITYLLFVLGFVLLIKGADWLVDGASSVALRFGWSPLFIGLTIVAFGTSAPELVVNVLASARGADGIAVGNILGSNIANILLILGIAAIITPLRVRSSTVHKEIPLAFLAVAVLGIFVNDQFFDEGTGDFLSRADGLVLMAFFAIFLYYTAAIRSSSADSDLQPRSGWIAAIMIISGLTSLVVGGQWIVEGGTAIARQFGLSEALIGLTIVAVGTSLPELATSAVAAYKGQTDVAIGNVVGSNIFNIFWVLALSAVISPITFSTALNLDVFVTTGVTVLLLLALYVGKRQVLQRWQGYGFVGLYAVYIAFLIYRG